jgi:hypothetical protein
MFLNLLIEAIICTLDWLAFSELYFHACTGVGGGEEQDGRDHLQEGRQTAGAGTPPGQDCRCIQVRYA